MKTSIQNINPLPMPTWRWLGVNGAGFEGELPDILPFEGLRMSELPKGIAPFGVGNAPAALATGLGQEAEAFILNHRNTSLALRAQGKAKDALVCRYVFTQNSPAAVDDNLIVAEAGSSAVVVQMYYSQDEAAHLHAGRTCIYAAEGSHITLVQVQMLNKNSTALCGVGAHIEKDARVDLVQIELGALQSFAASSAVLDGKRAHMENKTSYLVGGNARLDMNYVTRHIAPQTTCEMQAAGALAGKGDKIYRGTIDFVRGAARSVGHQQENILLFSPGCRNRSAPLILCGEENVEGQHAATIGRVDAGKQFYLQTRGLSAEQIKKLMVDAQFAPSLAALPTEALQEEVAAVLAERMQSL